MNCPHCDIHIDEHEATRCLDAWVSSKLMGMEVPEFCAYLVPTALCMTPKIEAHLDYLEKILPHYSTDISAAWEVVEKFRAWDIRRREESGYTWYSCDLFPIKNNVPCDWVIGDEAVTVPLAICHTAIKASQ